MLRVAIPVRAGELEDAIGAVLSLAPEGFVEEEGALVVYAEAKRAEQLLRLFPAATSQRVDPGWADEWRRFHSPVVVGPLWVGPPWLEPARGLIAVTIDPGRAFGTGAHETTRLCLELLVKCDGGSFLDVGCGSGVLAVAAAKLGSRPVIAIDADPAATEATARNAAANEVELDIRTSDARTADFPRTDVAAMNVNLETVEAVAPRLATRRLIVSGYLASDAPRLPGYRRLERRAAERFVADLYVRE